TTDIEQETVDRRTDLAHCLRRLVNNVCFAQCIHIARRVRPCGSYGKEAIRAALPVVVRGENLFKIVRLAATVGMFQQTDLARLIPSVENGSKPFDFMKDYAAGILSDVRIPRPDHQIHRRANDAFILEMMFSRMERRVDGS